MKNFINSISEEIKKEIEDLKKLKQKEN